ncbi:MAG: ArnT family glycosyltransferase [Candidatus Nanohaloarchaea archaeon]
MKEYVEEMRTEIQDRYFLVLLLVLAAATFVRFKYAFFDGMWVDEGRYARIGTEISRHLLDYSVLESWRGQITAYPPLYPYLIAISNLVLGQSEFAVRVVSPLMGVLAVGITYFTGKEMANKEVGLAAAALMALNPIAWFLSERILVGITFAAVYSAAVFCLYYGLEDREYSKYAIWAIGPLVALNILTKQPAYTLGVLIPLYFVYKKRNEFREVLMDDVEFAKTKLYETITDVNYYISGGLGIAVLAPWMLRNQAVCGVPLCGLARAMEFASKSTNPATSSVQGTFYYLFAMGTIVTLPVALLLLARVGYYLLKQVDVDPDGLVKRGAAVLFLTGAAYLAIPRLVPMALLSSIAFLARTDSEKLLWLWIGIGIGFMSIPTVKVPRYIVFVIPALTIVAGITLYEFSRWASDALDSSMVTKGRVLVAVMIPLLAFSFLQGSQMVSRGGFAQAEPAGEWLAQNTPEDAAFAASSPAILRYYIYPRMAYRFPENRSEFREFVEEKDINYIEVDVYERTQPDWVQTSIPPYRLPNTVRIKVQRGQMSAQQAAKMFSNPPDYLVPVKTVGKTRMPLNRQTQPVAMIYRINRSAMR